MTGLMGIALAVFGIITMVKASHNHKRMTTVPIPTPTPKTIAMTQYTYKPDDTNLIITITDSTQTAGKTVYLAMPQTTIAPFGITPKQAAEGADCLQFQLDHQHEIDELQACATLEECQRSYPEHNWDSVRERVQQCAPHLGDMQLAVKNAVVHAQQRNKMITSTLFLGPTPSSPRTAEVAVITPSTGTPYTITSIPTTISHTVYVHTSHFDGYAAAARETGKNGKPKKPQDVLPACQGPKHSKNATICRYQKCMLEHYKPINLTTVFQAAKFSSGCSTLNVNNPWYTQPTSVSNVHWGTTKSGMYYPHTPVLTPTKHGMASMVAMATVKPVHDMDKMSELRSPMEAAKAPTCWDRNTCCHECWEKARKGGWFGSLSDPWNFSTALPYLIILGAIAAALAILPCLLCCCLPRLRRRKEQKRRAEETVDKREKVTVVDPATGQETVVVTNTQGNTTHPAAASAVTAAAVVAAEDGKGTQSRRAEEGRGKVQFTPETAGPAASTVVTTTDPKTGEKVAVVTPAAETAKPAATEHVTTTATPAEKEKTTAEKDANAHAQKTEAHEEHAAPVPVHDGASDFRGTGSQIADMGSMRGRKRLHKPDSRGNLLNLGF